MTSRRASTDQGWWTSCRFHTEERGSFLLLVESIPVAGDTVELAGRSYQIRTVRVFAPGLAARFGHDAIAFCSPNGEISHPGENSVKQQKAEAQATDEHESNDDREEH